MLQAAQPPILIDNGMAVLENDLIERHIMKKIPGGHNLFVPDQVIPHPRHVYIYIVTTNTMFIGSQQED